mgnify:CR=1 FL=1
MAVSANRLELLQIADAVAREKVIDREIVLAAMADAIQKAARSRYGSETNIRADINSKTGEIRLQRLLEVVEKVEDYATQIALELALISDEEIGLPEPQRYGIALIRASERGLLDLLEQLINARER